jgi:hypothetical protein
MRAEAYRLPQEEMQPEISHSEFRLKAVPDIGNDVETAELSPEEKLTVAQRERVLAAVDKLDIDLDLRRHPEFLERLADTGEHFPDSVTMARIIEAIYPDLRDKLQLPEESPKQMMRAAVLHDIGKSGPAGEKSPVNAAVRRLFVPPTRPFKLMDGSRPKTIHDFVTELEYPDATEIEAALIEAGFEPDKEAIIFFWRRHAQWTYDILKTAPPELVDEKTLKIAASHHIFEAKNPAGLDLENMPVEAQILDVIGRAQALMGESSNTLLMSELLAAVDKYQAYRERLHMDHDTSIAWLAKFYSADPPGLSTETRESYLSVIEVLDRNQEALARLFSQKENV